MWRQLHATTSRCYLFTQKERAKRCILALLATFPKASKRDGWRREGEREKERERETRRIG